MQDGRLYQNWFGPTFCKDLVGGQDHLIKIVMWLMASVVGFENEAEG